MIVTKAALPDAGYFVLPRKWSLAALYAFAGLIVTASTGAAMVYHRVESLYSTDVRFEKRMDERRAYNEAQFADLRKRNEELIVVKEQVRLTLEVVRRLEDKIDRR